MNYEVDHARFESICKELLHQQIERNGGIGTLQEKTMHAVLKRYFEPDSANHEIRIGSFVADIANDERVIEIQTAQFNVMRRKLDAFLERGPVTIVHPIPCTKWLIWLDEETGEVTNRRKSPKVGSEYHAFRELYKIKPYLVHPNLSIVLVLVDLEEYRLLNGWSKDRKKGSSRYERIPLDLIRMIPLECPKDYIQLLPPELDTGFTTKDYQKAAHIPLGQAQLALNILNELQVVERMGKKGNAYLYRISELFT